MDEPVAVLKRKIDAKRQLVKQTEAEIDLLEREMQGLLITRQENNSPPARPSTPAPCKLGPIPSIRLVLGTTPIHSSSSSSNWKQMVNLVQQRVDRLTQGKRFWVGIASRNTTLQRMKDTKYLGFQHYALVFETNVDDERRCMETELISNNSHKTYNEINGGGGKLAGCLPLYVYIVY